MESILVKAVFLDVVGTLIHVRGTVGQIYWEMARSHGVRSSPEAIDRAFGEVFLKAPPLTFPQREAGTTRRLEKQWWYNVVKQVFEKVSPLERFDEYFESVFQAFSDSDAWELYPETLEVLSALKDRGFLICVISNFDSRLYPLLSNLGIFTHIDSVYISSRENAAKPDAKIFENALAQHRLQGTEVVHIGDSLKEDVMGAVGAGLRAIYLNRNGSTQPPEVLAISSLRELLPMLSNPKSS